MACRYFLCYGTFIKTTQESPNKAHSPQYKRARGAVGGIAVAGTATFIEGHDKLPFIGIEVVPNIISGPFILGGVTVAAICTYNLIKNARQPAVKSSKYSA